MTEPRRPARGWGLRLGVAALLVGVALLPLALFDRGDWFPFERTIRAAVGGWDMWATPAVRPFEGPMPPAPEGAVKFGGTVSFETASAAVASMTPDARSAAGKEAYRRYCSHCHAAAGDARSIVGESFAPKPTDLRSERVQSRPTRELFRSVRDGQGAMLPLADTLTPEQTLLALEHVRTLAGASAGSGPVFPPRDTAPLR